MKDKVSFTPSEMEIYEEGKKAAFRAILLDMGEAMTYRKLLRRLENFQTFLKKEKNQGKLATIEYETSIWEGHLNFSIQELESMVELLLRDYQARLKKAREIQTLNARLLRQFSQLTIDE